MPNPLNRHQELKALLERLKRTGMATQFSDLALRAAKEGLSHEAYLHELARQEDALRSARRTERLLRQSGLPAEKTFRTLDQRFLTPALQLQIERLKPGTFLEQAVNVVAVGYELILAGHAVFWAPTSTLVHRLLAAKRDLRLPQELAKLDRYACAILDDIGYVQQDRDEMEVLFTFLAERYESKSVLISTNLVFSEWERIFKSPMTTMAAIDRVTHHCVILDMMALDSYRAHQASHQHLSSPEEATTGTNT
jgi:DNA replication protein DnaC